MDYTQRYLHRLYPLTKITFVLVFAVVSVLSPRWPYLYGLFGVLCVLAATGSSLPVFLKKLSKSIMILFPLIFLLQTLFRPGTQVFFRLWIFSFKMEGVLYALHLCGILLVIASSFVLFFQVTELQDFILSLEKAGTSPTVSYVVLSTMQMIPQTKKRSEVIMNAQQARGIETKGKISTRIKAFIPMLAPLILSSFSGIEERALTLEARAFSAPIRKTNIHDIVQRPVDRTLRVAALVILVLAVVGRFTIWH